MTRPRSRATRVRTAFAALAASALAATGVPGQAPPSHTQEGLFEVVAPGLEPITTPVLVDTTQAILLPLEAVLSHLGYAVEAGPELWVWRAGAGAPEHRLTLDPARYLSAETGAVPVDARALAGYAGDLYVRTDVLADLLDAEARVDWSELRVVLDRGDPLFPARARARIEARRSRLVRPGPVDRGPAVPYPARSGGLIVDWSAGTTPFQELSYGRAAVGGAVLGGDLILGAAVSATRDSTAVTPEVAYRRIVPERDWINQVLVGQVLTQDLAPRSLVGVVVSNIPQHRDVRYGEVAVSPDIPEGWEFEVYQSGRLVGFSSAGAGDAVTVPVRYGQTPLEVRMVGPTGQEVVTPYRYLIPVTHLPPGRTEYSAGGGICPEGRCDGLGYVELRHGLDPRLTVGGGLQALSEDGAFRLRPSLLASLVPDRHWALDLEARAQEFVRASVDRVGDTGSHIGLDGSIHQSAFGQPSSLLEPGARWQVQARAGLHPVRASARVDGLNGGGVDRVRLAVGASVARGFSELGLEKGSFGADRVTGRTTSVLPERWWAFGRPATATGSIAVTRLGVQVLELGGALRPLQASYLSGAVQWNRDLGGLHLALTFRQMFGGARVSASAARRGGTGNLTLSADGGIAIDATRRVDFSARDLQHRAGVVGRVYYDRDGDRRYGAGDDPAAGVAVLVGGTRTRTDDQGFYRAWSVLPYVVTSVAVDTLSGIDPRYTVTSGGALLRPVPHVGNRIDFPLTETRELLGRVVTASGQGVGGVEVEVLQVEGDRRVSTRTYSDGTFYVSRLLPGDWTVGVAQPSLEALDRVSEPGRVPLRVRLDDTRPLIELAPFVLHQPPGPPGDGGPPPQ